jgi:hypothetical protein
MYICKENFQSPGMVRAVHHRHPIPVRRHMVAEQEVVRKVNVGIKALHTTVAASVVAVNQKHHVLNIAARVVVYLIPMSMSHFVLDDAPGINTNTLAGCGHVSHFVLRWLVLVVVVVALRFLRRLVDASAADWACTAPLYPLGQTQGVEVVACAILMQAAERDCLLAYRAFAVVFGRFHVLGVVGGRHRVWAV